MADAGTLATTAQVLLSIGENPSTAQALEANTNIWILYAESDIEKELGDNVEIVANYGTVTAALKQSYAAVAADRAAWYGIDQDQNNWSLATTQSKLNTKLTKWKAFVPDLKNNKADRIADLGL